MVSKTLNYIVLFILTIHTALAAQPDTFVRPSVNAKRVKVKQRFELKISVYTSTWFTSAPNLDNIVIPGALTIKKDRAQSTYEVINDIRYTILYFEFLVFPLKQGELLIPKMTLRYATPEQGDFKGIEVERKTKPLNLKVDSLAEGFSLNNWLVATSCQITESWNHALNKLKIGDVIERTITIKATGTIAALIPSSDSLAVNWGKAYGKTPILNSKIVEGEVRSERTEHISILLEKAGEYHLPAHIFTWWDPRSGRVKSKKIEQKLIKIADNPDLAILNTLQDSLNAVYQSEQIQPDNSQPWKILGLRWWQVLLIFAAVFIAGQQLLVALKQLREKMASKRAAFLLSEEYGFRQLKQVCHRNNPEALWEKLTSWWLRFPDHITGQSLRDFITRNGDNDLVLLYDQLNRQLYSGMPVKTEFPCALFIQKLENLRRTSLRQQIINDSDSGLEFRLNP